MTRIFQWLFMWKMDPMSGFDICLVFTLPPSDSTLQCKRCVHLWNKFPCIKSLLILRFPKNETSETIVINVIWGFWVSIVMKHIQSILINQKYWILTNLRSSIRIEFMKQLYLKNKALFFLKLTKIKTEIEHCLHCINIYDDHCSIVLINYMLSICQHKSTQLCCQQYNVRGNYETVLFLNEVGKLIN